MTAPVKPSPITRAAIAAVLQADPGVSPSLKARVLAAFDSETDTPRLAGWVPASIAAKQAGVSLPTILRWADKGAIASRRQGERVTLVNADEVTGYAATRQHKEAP